MKSSLFIEVQLSASSSPQFNSRREETEFYITLAKDLKDLEPMLQNGENAVLYPIIAQQLDLESVSN